MCCSVWIWATQSVRLLNPPSYSYPNYPYQSLSYCLNISVQSFSYFVVPLFSANTSGALSYKVLGFCYITAANCQYPDPHKMIFCSLLMKMQLTGENISQNSLKYLFFNFFFYYQFSKLIVFTHWIWTRKAKLRHRGCYTFQCLCLWSRCLFSGEVFRIYTGTYSTLECIFLLCVLMGVYKEE